MSRMTHPLEVILDEKFWSRVEKASSGCWLWTGAAEHWGHGQVRLKNGPRVKVHRLVYERLVGEIPEGFVVHHKCRVPACCNPQHLQALPISEHSRVERYFVPKTHCPQGHAFTTENTYVPRDGYARCRKCRVLHSKAFQLRKRALAVEPIAEEVGRPPRSAEASIES